MKAFECRSEHYDVLVAGGGLSGVCAAVAAARHGAKTVLIQNRSVLGGNASSEVRMHIVGGGCHNSKPHLNETGILLEMLLKNKRRNRFHSFPVWDGIVWETARFQENLTTYLNMTLEEVDTDGAEIRSVLCRQQTTETAVRMTAEIYIDATGNATLGKLAGAPYRVGSEGKAEFNEPSAPDEPNDDTMGCSIMFQAVNRGEPVRFEKPEWAYTFTEHDLRYRKHVNLTTATDDNGDYVEFKKGAMKALPQFSTIDAGYWWIELGGQYSDIVRGAEDIRDELLKCVYGVWDHIKNQGDHGADNYDLEWVGMLPGYRESRRIEGDYMITENDVRANRVFDDAVAYGAWPMDIHVREGLFAFDKLPSKTINFDGAYTIPYRCYLPKGIENMMMAGRAISASKMAFGSLRVMGTCSVGGQAVGTAAAMAVRYGVGPRGMEAHMRKLQQELLKDDCYLPGFKNEDDDDLARRSRVQATSQLPGCEAANVINGVSRTVGDQSNVWESAPLSEGPQTLTLRLDAPHTLRQARLTFDPNLSREIMPSITSIVRERQCKFLPEELVKDYTLRLKKQRETVWEKRVSDNGQRLNVVEIPGVACDAVELTVEATHGYPAARVFEVRLY